MSDETASADGHPAGDPTHPRTILRGVARAFLAFTIVFGGWQAVRFSRASLGRAGDVAVDGVTPKKPAPAPVPEAERERALRAEIAALDSKIEARKDALARLDSAMKARTISRQDDRNEFNKINEEIVALQGQRADVEARLAARSR